MSPHEKLWNQFTCFLKTIELQNTTTEQFICNLIDWLQMNRCSFTDELWNRYQFDRFISMQCDDYCIEFQEDDLENVIINLLKQSRSSKDVITMLIRDILWDAIVYKTDTICPLCGDDQLRALIDRSTKKIILSCDLCPWVQDEYGHKNKNSKNSENLQIANKSDVKLLCQARPVNTLSKN